MGGVAFSISEVVYTYKIVLRRHATPHADKFPGLPVSLAPCPSNNVSHLIPHIFFIETTIKYACFNKLYIIQKIITIALWLLPAKKHNRIYHVETCIEHIKFNVIS
jgi:hypothetical protein